MTMQILFTAEPGSVLCLLFFFFLQLIFLLHKYFFFLQLKLAPFLPYFSVYQSQIYTQTFFLSMQFTTSDDLSVLFLFFLEVSLLEPATLTLVWIDFKAHCSVVILGLYFPNILGIISCADSLFPESHIVLFLFPYFS